MAADSGLLWIVAPFVNNRLVIVDLKDGGYRIVL